ncbi:unnamed protein product [Lactuca saligna]|uniref:Regulatory protein RecX n=1 Tax=Lactuca saligna TaxID=75948 RepID=A0AA36EJ91_LACSI|nr:unnamed protein product [Lactuca saligna]
MAIFAGKCIYGAAFELQSRVFVKPWATMIIVRCCSNSDESSMNFPVRSSIGFSVHEKSLDNDFKEGHVISKEKKTCNSNVRLEVGEPDYKSDEFDAMEGLDEDLDGHDSLNGEYEIKNLTIKTKEEAEKTAIRLLGARAYTALELKKKLIGKKFSHEVVNAVISDFQNRGFINDLLYAESFSRSRWSSSSWGPRRIKQALAKKGVNDVDAQKAIKVVLEDGETVSRFGLSKPSMDHLFAQVSKQWLRAKDLPTEKQKSRIINWLQYRGFNWGVINFILKKLQSEHPP